MLDGLVVALLLIVQTVGEVVVFVQLLRPERRQPS